MADTITSLLTKPFVVGPIIALFVFAGFGAVFSSNYLVETQDPEDQIALKKSGVLTIKGSIDDAELRNSSMRELENEIRDIKENLRAKEEGEKAQKVTAALDIKRIVGENEKMRNEFIAYHKKYRDFQCEDVIGDQFDQLNIKGVGLRKNIKIEKIDVKKSRVYFTYQWETSRMKHDVSVSKFPREFQERLQLQLPHALKEALVQVKAPAPKLQMPLRAAPRLGQVNPAKQLQRIRLQRRKNDIAAEANMLKAKIGKGKDKHQANEREIHNCNREADERLFGHKTTLQRERGRQYREEAEKLERANQHLRNHINEAEQRQRNLKEEYENIDRQLQGL